MAASQLTAMTIPIAPQIVDRLARTQRPWGWYETVCESPHHKIKRIGVLPGQRISLQKHRQRAEHWVVVQGTAQVTLGERSFDLCVGQHCDIALGQVHRLANETSEPMEIIEVQFGAYLGEDDIERLGDDYGRV
jgi:mannose-6-phosphate isomerase